MLCAPVSLLLVGPTQLQSYTGQLRTNIRFSQQLLRVKMSLAVTTKHSRDQHRLHKALLEIQLLKKSLHSDWLDGLGFELMCG